MITRNVCIHIARELTLKSIFILLLLFCAPSLSLAAASLTQHGITWIFDADYVTGQFVNGDYWVLDPGSGVRITGISPGYTSTPRGMNGSMIDPGGSYEQGYDGFTVYNSSLNVGIGISESTPLTITGNHSLISTISNEVCGDLGGGSHVSFVKTAAVLTILTSAPPANSFRPGAGDGSKKIYNYSQLRFDRLKSLGTGVTTPTKAYIDSYVTDKTRMIWLVHSNDWRARYMRPSDGLENYYYTDEIVAGVLWLHSDTPQEDKINLLINIVQMGLDVYSYIEAGTRWGADGGHFSARQALPVVAGVLLDDQDMYNVGVTLASGLGNEGSQTFYVTQATIDAGVPSEHSPYTSDMIGMPEWMDKSSTRDSSWRADYRDILSGGPYWGAEATSLVLFGAKEVFNRPAFFDYVKRYMAINKGDPDPFGYTVPNQSTILSRGGVWGQSMYDTYFETYKNTDFRGMGQRRLFRNVRVSEVEL